MNGQCDGKAAYVSIVSTNYLGYACTLAESLGEVVGGHLQILVVDRKNDETLAAVGKTGLDFIFADELGLVGFEKISYKFDITELNTALKPSFLKLMLERGYERVIYFDPDIYIYSPLDPINKALDESEIVLTPHSTKPVLDGARPSDVDFLRTGTFNLGFIGIRRGDSSAAFLDWWERRCLGLGYNDTGFGTFVDQKWVDLAPCYFESVGLLKHKGCNVAYWNIHERQLEVRHSVCWAGSELLVFFHFSGIRLNNGASLSRHQTRFSAEEIPVISELAAMYRERLLNNGQAEFEKIGYTFGSLSNGVPITKTMRRALACQVGQITDPFNASSSFQRRLRARGIWPKHFGQTVARNSINLDTRSTALRLLNACIRGVAKIIGADRVLALFTYFGILTRESHLAAVLLKSPLDFRHVER